LKIIYFRLDEKKASDPNKRSTINLKGQKKLFKFFFFDRRSLNFGDNSIILGEIWSMLMDKKTRQVVAKRNIFIALEIKPF